MEWEFTPEQVVRAEVDYGLEQFRADMLEEVKLNMNGMESAASQYIFNIMYDLCYWVATGNDYAEFLASLDQDSFIPAFLGSIKNSLVPNIEMLGAILQRLIMERVDEQGMSLEKALVQVDELNQLVVAKSMS